MASIEMPYPALGLSLCIGQVIPAICGVLLVNVLERSLGGSSQRIFRRQKV